jgi:hypothetical protein
MSEMERESEKNLDTPPQNLIIITLFCYHLYGYNVKSLSLPSLPSIHI